MRSQLLREDLPASLSLHHVLLASAAAPREVGVTQDPPGLLGQALLASRNLQGDSVAIRGAPRIQEGCEEDMDGGKKTHKLVSPVQRPSATAIPIEGMNTFLSADTLSQSGRHEGSSDRKRCARHTDSLGSSQPPDHCKNGGYKEEHHGHGKHPEGFNNEGTRGGRIGGSRGMSEPKRSHQVRAWPQRVNTESVGRQNLFVLTRHLLSQKTEQSLCIVNYSPISRLLRKQAVNPR